MEFISKSRLCSKICDNIINFKFDFFQALIFEKFKLFKSINKSTEDFEKKFWKAKSAESFNNSLPSNSNDPATLIFKAAMVELKLKDTVSSISESSKSFRNRCR